VYLPVLIFASVPTVTLALWALGVAVTIKPLVAVFRRAFGKPHRVTGAGERLGLDLLAMLVPLGPFFLPATPIFGGTKHWMPAYPFMALFAARGIFFVGRGLRSWLRAKPRRFTVQPILITVLLAITLTAGPLAETWSSHPFGLSAYVAAVGGTAGGASLGLNRQFWGFTTQSLAPWIESNTKPGDRIFIHDTTGGAWAQMVAEHRLPADRHAVGSIGEANVAIVHHELHMAEAEANIMTLFGGSPAYVLTQDGVPIISVYKRAR
jgi:hypothetical protein